MVVKGRHGRRCLSANGGGGCNHWRWQGQAKAVEEFADYRLEVGRRLLGIRTEVGHTCGLVHLVEAFVQCVGQNILLEGRGGAIPCRWASTSKMSQ